MLEESRRDDIQSMDGSTYEIKTPHDDRMIYVTINHKILNEGTPEEGYQPFEMFINSQNRDHFMWIVALTRLISAIFRRGGDVSFVAHELQMVFDPRGGQFTPGGQFAPSLVAEIGTILEKHLLLLASKQESNAFAQKTDEDEDPPFHNPS